MELPEAVAVLARTPTVLDGLLAGLADEWVRRDDGPGTWSAYDIVGHLIHGEANDWVARARLILEHGPDREFVPFDREGMFADPPEPMAARLARFAAARSASLAALDQLALTPADLDRRGRHPAFGPVTLGQLLATWVAHDLTHVAQIGEVLARRYREDVGPWRAYLPALDRVADAE
jgi:hypothetical protein